MRMFRRSQPFPSIALVSLVLLTAMACQRAGDSGASELAEDSNSVEPVLGPYRLGDLLETSGSCGQYHDDATCLTQSLGEHYHLATLEGRIVRVQETFSSNQTPMLEDHFVRTYGEDYRSRTGLGLVIWEWEFDGLSVQAVFDENPSIALYATGRDREAFEAASEASRARAEGFLDSMGDSFAPLVEELGPESYERYKALRLDGMTDEHARERLASAS